MIELVELNEISRGGILRGILFNQLFSVVNKSSNSLAARVGLSYFLPAKKVRTRRFASSSEAAAPHNSLRLRLARLHVGRDSGNYALPAKSARTRAFLTNANV